MVALGRCALAMPVYNEDPARTTGGLYAMAQELIAQDLARQQSVAGSSVAQLGAEGGGLIEIDATEVEASEQRSAWLRQRFLASAGFALCRQRGCEA